MKSMTFTEWTKESLKYSRWHIRIDSRFLPTCYTTKKAAETGIKEFLTDRPQFSNYAHAYQTRCAMLAISRDCLNKMPKRLRPDLKGWLESRCPRCEGAMMPDFGIMYCRECGYVKREPRPMDEWQHSEFTPKRFSMKVQSTI
jgi:hypothetical protein